MQQIITEPGRWPAGRLGLRDDGWQKAAKYMLICVSALTLSEIAHVAAWVRGSCT